MVDELAVLYRCPRSLRTTLGAPAFVGDISVPGIWPPHEVFYIEAMLFHTTAALRAAHEVHEALELGARHASASAEWQQSALEIISGAQVIALQAAALSRYLWPPRDQEPHASRASQLRQALGIHVDSRLRSRELRNHLEHFDERLDEFCGNLVAGHIMTTYVGPSGLRPEVPTSFFRAYFTDVAVLEVLGKQFELSPVLEEVEALHVQLRRCVDEGGRLRPSLDPPPSGRLTCP